jgi:Protein of unknown function (DUF1549)/Protein of unknown function (DUF1553)
MKAFACSVFVFSALAVVPATHAQTSLRLAAITVEPAPITLTHRHDEQRLLVTGKLPDETLRDLTLLARYTSLDTNIASVSPSGLVRPVGVGETKIEIAAGYRTQVVTVSVKSLVERPVSYAQDVMPLFAKAGCNSGACHGSASGKKGFKVSLRGYDPGVDFVTLTRGANGRRIDRAEPEQSLLILKPTGQVPHEGGQRFGRESAYAKTLARWIKEGCSSDLATAPKLVGLDVWPAYRTFAEPRLQQQLLVRARFQDGSVRDVTADARYSSNNENAALVGEDGLVKMPSKGEAAIMVRYGSVVAVSNLVVLRRDPNFVWTDPPEANYIDKLVFAKLRSMQIQPSELCTDEEFLRRVYLDVIGLSPTPAEVRAFLADQRTDKRARVIDALLERPEYAEFWAAKWADLFRLRFDVLRDKGTWGYYRWLRDSMASNKPYDQFVRELVAAEGSCDENPPANFYRVFTTPDDMAEATAQIFLGIRTMCSKCHDHPFEKWVQKDYYGMSAFFSQTARKPGSKRDDVIVSCNEAVAQARHPTTGELLSPKFLDGPVVNVPAQQDGRAVLAQWLTSKDNPFLARAVVNRLWSHLLGRGIIDPVDDIRSSNPPSNAALLEALSKDFLERNFDQLHLIRTILNSRTYQLSGRTTPSNADDKQNFSHYQPRRLTAEQMVDSVAQITGTREGFQSRIPGAGTVALPVTGLRASQLPDRLLTSAMLDLFGRPRGESSCTCERTDEASMAQALHLINSKTIVERLSNPNGNLTKLLKTAGLSDEKLIEELYVSILCRLPQENEKAVALRHLAAHKRDEGALDLAWALLNTKEFLFNH